MRCAKNVVLTATVALSLAACAEDPNSPSRFSSAVNNAAANTSTSQDMNSTANMSDFERRAGQQPVPVMVQGNAFGLDRTALERQVANDMKGAYWGPRAQFVPASQAQMAQSGKDPEYTVVMLLSPTGAGQPAQRVTGAQLCADQYRLSAVGSPTTLSNQGSANVTTEGTPPRGAPNPAMRNDAAGSPNYPGAASSQSRAASNSQGSSGTNVTTEPTPPRGAPNPAMRNDAAGSPNYPGAIGEERPQNSASAATPAQRNAATANQNRSAAANSARAGARSDVHLVSALCRYDQTVNQVDSRAANISGPNDPAFHNLIVNATNQLTQPNAGATDKPASPGQER